jgi:alkaline phosphatase
VWRIDHTGHANGIARSIGETIELSNAVQLAVDWAEGRDDTLIIVTADHETGGLTVLQNNGAGVLPSVSWSTTSPARAREMSDIAISARLLQRGRTLARPGMAIARDSPKRLVEGTAAGDTDPAYST